MARQSAWRRRLRRILKPVNLAEFFIQIVQERICGNRFACRELNRADRVAQSAEAMDLFRQPTPGRAGIAVRQVAIKIGQISAHRFVQATRINISERIRWKIAEYPQ